LLLAEREKFFDEMVPEPRAPGICALAYRNLRGLPQFFGLQPTLYNPDEALVNSIGDEVF
jgi:hypothetical protein